MNYLVTPLATPTSTHEPPATPRHTFPVTPSVMVTLSPACIEVYRFGLVRLYKRIAAKMAATPSLNCVLVMQGR